MSKDLSKLKDDLYQQTKIQRKRAWGEKDYKKCIKLREKEKETYEKWRLLNGIIKANEKEGKENEVE